MPFRNLQTLGRRHKFACEIYFHTVLLLVNSTNYNIIVCFFNMESNFPFKKQAETSVIITANFCLFPYFSVFFVLFPFYCVLSVFSSSGFL